jgi:hypothetical protein
MKGVLMKLFVSLLVFLAAFSAQSATPMPTPTCEEKYEIFDNTQVQMTPGSNNCYLSIHPRNVFDLVYRDFLFDTKGIFMIFNSYGKGPDSSSTGAREYYFFPRTKASFDVQYNATAKLLAVQLPSGKTAVFNTEKSILVSISGTTFTQDFDVNANNKGGIEITANDGLMMDGGFRVGQSPSQSPKDKTVFKDAEQNVCGLVNSDVYKYTSESDVIFKYNDTQLKAFLKKKCPKLKM